MVNYLDYLIANRNMNTSEYPIVGPNYTSLIRNSRLQSYMDDRTSPEEIMKTSVFKRDLDTLLDLISSGYSASYSDVEGMNSSDYSYLLNACEIMNGGLSLTYHEREMMRIRLFGPGQYYPDSMLEELTRPVSYKKPRVLIPDTQAPV